jgi:hypothetical protein
MTTKKKRKVKKKPVKPSIGFMIRRIGTTEFSNGKDSPYVSNRTKKIWRTIGLLHGHLSRVEGACRRINARYKVRDGVPQSSINNFYDDCEIVEIKVAKITDLKNELFLRGI